MAFVVEGGSSASRSMASVSTPDNDSEGPTKDSTSDEGKFKAC